MRAVGPDAWSARFIPGLFSVGCVLLLFVLGELLFSAAVGFAAAFVLTLSPEFIGYGARFHLDTPLTFFILLSFIGWKKRSWVLIGAAVGWGLWVKSPVALLIFPAAILELALTTGFRDFKPITVLLKSTLLAVFMGAVFWIITGMLGGWHLISDYWYRQVYGTAVGGRGFRIDPFLFADILKTRYWPWLPALLFSVYFIIRHKSWKLPSLALPLSGAVVVITVISAMRFKFPHYYLPMYPFLALLVVFPARHWLEARLLGVQTFLIGATLVAGALLLSTPIGFSPEMFPSLKPFNAIIQSFGNCRDKVLFIEGHQPYGSFGDYGAEVTFYTNRPFLHGECSEANSLVQKENPAWVIISGDNLNRCLAPDARARFVSHYRFGNQTLLSTWPQRDPSEIDLTFLDRELKAVADCSPIPLSRDRYHAY